METPTDQYQAFTEVFSEEELQHLASEYGVADQRERKLPLRIFFWLMVLSAGQPTARGALFRLVAFFVASLSGLFPRAQVVTLTKMALSLKLKHTDWFFFRGVYQRLLARYRSLLPPSERTRLEAFKEVFLLDATITRVHKALTQLFESVHKDQAACKIHVRYSLKNLAPQKLQVTGGKRHDSRFRAITRQPGILYLFDLGYWSFTRLHQIVQAASFFVCRLKSTCDPLIVAVTEKRWHPLVGKRLSEILDLLKGEEHLDVTVKLSKAPQPRFNDDLRLVGLLYEGTWRFYLTNLFQSAFTPQVIYDLYRQRWAIEIFFNFFKHLLHIEHLIARTKNGILVEIYSALIFYLLTQIVIALAARKTGTPIEAFSFPRSLHLVWAFLVTHLADLLDRTRAGLREFFGPLVESVALLGLKDKPARSP
jgi:hypothetical protein